MEKRRELRLGSEAYQNLECEHSKEQAKETEQGGGRNRGWEPGMYNERRIFFPLLISSSLASSSFG